MKQIDDLWYVSLPNGRVKRASSTRALRRHLEQGNIPLNSRVRRSEDDEWIALEWTEEFHDVVTLLRAAHHTAIPHLNPEQTKANGPVVSSGASVSSRLDPQRLRTIGVNAWITELLAALDSVLVFKKLVTAGLGSLILGVVLALFRSGFVNLEALGYGLSATVTAGGLLLVFALSSALLLQLSYVEVTLLRPARWAEGFKGLISQTFRLVLGFLLVLGGLVLVLGGLVCLIVWLLSNLEPPWGAYRLIGAATAGVAVVLGCLALLALFFVNLLLGPILIAERCSIWKALGLWRQVLRRNLGRVLAYEILALSVGLLVTAPFAGPVALMYWLPFDDRLAVAKTMTCDILAGMATAPLLAYLTVANLFIYLNMQYGTNEARRGPRKR
jgi:hypothetical protein